MTSEEAKANLEKLLLLYDDGMIDFSEIRESVKVAIDALERQIPRKWHLGKCSCGYDWGKDAPFNSVPNYCPNCGAHMEGWK